MVKWKKQRFYMLKKTRVTGHKNICRPNGDHGADRQQRVDEMRELRPMSQQEPYVPVPDGLLEL
jgi:hypothetical protein